MSKLLERENAESPGSLRTGFASLPVLRMMVARTAENWQRGQSFIPGSNQYLPSGHPVSDAWSRRTCQTERDDIHQDDQNVVNRVHGAFVALLAVEAVDRRERDVPVRFYISAAAEEETIKFD